MARLACRKIIDPSEVQVCDALTRCVRRAYLCGDDPVTCGREKGIPEHPTPFCALNM